MERRVRQMVLQMSAADCLVLKRMRPALFSCMAANHEPPAARPATDSSSCFEAMSMHVTPTSCSFVRRTLAMDRYLARALRALAEFRLREEMEGTGFKPGTLNAF